MKVYNFVAPTLMATAMFATSCSDKFDDPFNWLPNIATNTVIHECKLESNTGIKEAVFNLNDFQVGDLYVKFIAEDESELLVYAPNSLVRKDEYNYRRWSFDLSEYLYGDQENMPSIILTNPVFWNDIYGPNAPSYTIKSKSSYSQRFYVSSYEGDPIYTLYAQMIFSAVGLDVSMHFGSEKDHIRPDGEDFVMPDMRGGGSLNISKKIKSEKQISKVTCSENNGIYSYNLYMGDEDSYVTFVVSGENFGKSVAYTASAAESSVVPGIFLVEKGEDYFFTESDGSGRYLVKEDQATGSVTLALTHKSGHESIAFYYSGQIAK